MSEMCCTRLGGNAGSKKFAMAPSHNFVMLYLCKVRIDNPKKIVKQQYLPHMSSQ